MRNPVLGCGDRGRCAARCCTSAAGSLSVPINDFGVLHRRWRRAFACRYDRDNINADDDYQCGFQEAFVTGCRCHGVCPINGRQPPTCHCTEWHAALTAVHLPHVQWLVTRSSSRQDMQQILAVGVHQNCPRAKPGFTQGFCMSAAVHNVSGAWPVMRATHQLPPWRMPAP